MRVVPLVVLAGVWLAGSAALAQDVPIVYVRCPRTMASIDLTADVTVGGATRSVTRTMSGLDIYDVLPDVTHFFSGFAAPCDLVVREPTGEERVVFDCSSTSTDAASCAAMDPAVSFDGRTVAFTVFRGPLEAVAEGFDPRVLDPAAEATGTIWRDLPNRVLAATEAQLHLLDVASGVVTELPYVEGMFDAGPAWLPDGRLAFTSSRDDSRTTLIYGTNNPGRGARIHTMDIDGRNLDLASHHGLSIDEHPLTLRDGRVAYSSWQIFGGLPFRHTNGSPGGFTTTANLFHLYTQNPDGAVPFAFYGQHCGDHEPITMLGGDHKAAHFLTQATDGRVWFADYYRGNNNGLGIVVGVMPEPEGQEGIAPGPGVARGDYFAPRDVMRAASWDSSSDNFARLMPDPPYTHPSYADPVLFAGKTGHPGALPENRLMITWGKGACSTVTGNEVFESLGRVAPPLTSGSGGGTGTNVFTSLGLDTPACDAGIYLLTRIPSEHPSDLAVVVDTEEHHEIMARAIVPYAAIHGVERPMLRPRADLVTSRSELDVGTPFGLLGAASMLDRETHPGEGIHFMGEHQFNMQGTDTIDYTDDAICGVRILAVQPNRGPDTYEELAGVAGERVVVLGEIPVRNLDAGGAPRMDPSGAPDTSFLVRFPANMPYLMQGVDCDGRTLNTDQTWQSLRPGEVKTCGGCHVHSRASRVTFEQTFASMPEYAVPRLGEGQVPLLAGAVGGVAQTRTVPGYGLQIDYTRDIAPIFASRCNSCHGGAAPMGDLALDRPGLEAGSTWHCLVADRGQECVPSSRRLDTGVGSGTTLRRPQLTRYMRAFNAVSSLLYWKAAGTRTDGRTDATFGDASPVDDRDVDFGAAHTTEITPDELGLLGRWIDIGAPGGPMELRDTQRPTLHLAALVDGESVTALRVGTVDVPSGIDPASLEVCLLDASGACGPNLAGPAEMHGVVEVALASPLSDPDAEVRARVRDVAGNETVVIRTVGYLFGSPSPPPPAGDGGPLRDGGPGGGGGDDGGCGCRVARPATTSPWLGAALVLALAGLRRRRRLSRSPVP